MKQLFFLLIFFFSFHSQTQVLIEYPINQNMNLFDWEAFVNEEHIEDIIDDRIGDFIIFGPGLTTIDTLNIGKSDLVQLEQELGLYKQGIKQGLSVEVSKAEEVINRHWSNIRDIENQFQYRAGLKPIVEGFEVQRIVESHVGNKEGFNIGLLDLYNKDHDILFNLVEKTDENLHKNILNSNDEAYADLILPQIEKYTEKIENTTQAYYQTLLSSYGEESLVKSGDGIDVLLNIYSKSFEVYNCFLKNFDTPTGANQQKLRDRIESWHAVQGALGANSLIKTYEYKKGQEIWVNPWRYASLLHQTFDTADDETKEVIAEFFKREFIHNEDFINTNNRYKLGARSEALVGLESLGKLGGEELQLFNRALEQGVIRPSSSGAFSGYSRPIQ